MLQLAMRQVIPLLEISDDLYRVRHGPSSIIDWIRRHEQHNNLWNARL
jgi:hypothetical protein